MQKPHISASCLQNSSCSGVELVALRQALDRAHACVRAGRPRAASRRSAAAVDEHRARAAVAAVAHELRAGQRRLAVAAQRVEQRRARLDAHGLFRAVDRRARSRFRRSSVSTLALDERSCERSGRGQRFRVRGAAGSCCTRATLARATAGARPRPRRAGTVGVTARALPRGVGLRSPASGCRPHGCSSSFTVGLAPSFGRRQYGAADRHQDATGSAAPWQRLARERRARLCASRTGL